jgi:hypothetical protein
MSVFFGTDFRRRIFTRIDDMKIGYIYLFGQEWEEWKKHNPPLAVLVDQLNSERCDKIYMDAFIPYQEIEAIQQIERIDIRELLDRILDSKYDDQLIVRGKIKSKDDKELSHQIEKEFNRISNLHNFKI